MEDYQKDQKNTNKLMVKIKARKWWKDTLDKMTRIDHNERIDLEKLKERCLKTVYFASDEKDNTDY